MGVEVTIDMWKMEELIRKGRVDVVWIIHDGVEYGIFQEFSTAAGGRPRRGGKGTTGPGHPSLVPAFERVTRDLPKIVRQAIERGVDLGEVLGKMAKDIQNLWATDVNVDTGAYKNSITSRRER